jgi:translation initiation factor IF-1
MTSPHNSSNPSDNNGPRKRSGGGGGSGAGGRRRPHMPPQRHRAAEDDEAASENAIELEGTVAAVLAGTMFRVKLANEHLVLAHISGKMRKRFIRLVVGDRVKIEMSPYDTDKARIVYRLG